MSDQCNEKYGDKLADALVKQGYEIGESDLTLEVTAKVTAKKPDDILVLTWTLVASDGRVLFSKTKPTYMVTKKSKRSGDKPTVEEVFEEFNRNIFNTQISDLPTLIVVAGDKQQTLDFRPQERVRW